LNEKIGSVHNISFYNNVKYIDIAPRAEKKFVQEL